METKKVLGIIFSLLFVGAFAFVLSWGIINFNKVKDGMSGTGVYTKEDINKSYEDGYNTALTDKEEYTKLIASYRDTITTLNDNISQLNSQVTTLTNNNKDYANQLTQLNEQKTNLQSQVDNLTTIKTNNETTIASLNTQITSLQNQVTNLTNSGEDKSEQITILNEQITNFQKTISQLQTTNELNTNTITSLNTQIVNLNNQISEMTLISQNSQSQINALNNKITELQKSVTYYESYIASLENGEQVVATFEFDGSVYNIQIVNKGSKLAVTNPTSTTYKIFNGWTVNGETIDLNTYTINANTKIVADVTYKYDVKFMVDETTYNSQIIIKNGNATLPINPTKDGYDFIGWSLNGVDLITDISSKQVTANTTYIAVFTKIHTVTFMSEGQIISTQTVRNGGYATLSTNPTKDGYEFVGWSLNGVDVISNFENKQIYVDTIYIAVFNKVSDLVYKSWNGLRYFSGGNIWTDGENIYYSAKSKQYILDKETSTWTEKTWNGLNNFYGARVLIVEDKIYYFTVSSQYVLDKETSTWIEKIFNWSYSVDFSISNIWTDGENIYYSSGFCQFVLDKETLTWTEKTWNGIKTPKASNIWTDGIDYYCFYSSKQYILDKETSTWTEKVFSDITDFNAKCIWTDGENIYYSGTFDLDENTCDYHHYVLDKETSTWVEKIWMGFDNFSGDDIWTDGENIYYSYYYNSNSGVNYMFI